jgi:hypothetical protein
MKFLGQAERDTTVCMGERQMLAKDFIIHNSYFFLPKKGGLRR